ncbi:MAG: esterase [Burkholderiales bacterium]|nr:esterase [Burkholderiales bacterium]
MTPLVVYLHGFRSSPRSVKAQATQRYVDAMPAADRPVLLVPDLGDRPAAAIAKVLALVAANRDPGAPLAFIGSSLGGYYATVLAERLDARAVLVNPTTRPYDDLDAWRGVQTNLYTGERFVVTDGHFAELRALAVPRITRPERYFLLVETGDEVLDWRLASAYYAGAWQFVRGGGDHALQCYEAQLPTILRFACARDAARW